MSQGSDRIGPDRTLVSADLSDHTAIHHEPKISETNRGDHRVRRETMRKRLRKSREVTDTSVFTDSLPSFSAISVISAVNPLPFGQSP